MRRPLILSIFALVIVLVQAVPSDACWRWRNRGCSTNYCAPCFAQDYCWCLYYDDGQGPIRQGCYEKKWQAIAAAVRIGCLDPTIHEPEWDPKCCCWRWCKTVVKCNEKSERRRTCDIYYESCPERGLPK